MTISKEQALEAVEHLFEAYCGANVDTDDVTGLRDVARSHIEQQAARIAELEQPRELDVPAFYVSRSLIDPSTGKVRPGFGDAIEWSNSPVANCILPVYVGPQRPHAQQSSGAQGELRYTSDGALAECPCCGSLDVGGAHDTVHCQKCGLTVTKPTPLKNAMDAWNTRTGRTHFAPAQGGPDVRLRIRFDEIEREILAGKHTAPSVFIQMRTAALYRHPAPAQQPAPPIPDAVRELLSGVRTINRATQHIVEIEGDDEPCYYQRAEWIKWILELADKAEHAISAAQQPAGAVFSRDEIDLLRQWYNSIKDVNPQYLDSDGFQDTALYERICALLSAGPAPTQEPVSGTDELPDISSDVCSALLFVLWHNQGGSSTIGQPIRRMLGIGQHDRMTDDQCETAKRVLDALSAQAQQLDVASKWRNLAHTFDAQRMQFRDLLRAVANRVRYEPAIGLPEHEDLRALIEQADDALKSPPPAQQPAVPEGFRTSAGGAQWPKVGHRYLIRLNGVLQHEVFQFDQGDDGIGGGEYFWSRDDLDECPAFNPERDEWLPLDAVAPALLSAQKPGQSPDDLIHVGYTNPAQIKYAKEESGFFYPDTDQECHIPLYMQRRHLIRLGHDHPTLATSKSERERQA